MKKPFLFALLAALYIVLLVLGANLAPKDMPDNTILIPMAMLSLLVLSVAVMGFLFFYEPLCLYMENKKKEAVVFFGKTVGIFACFVVIFLILLLLL
ncbi:MAG: hypothetical protein WC603_00515 [Candidatus Paceibacterota bacterium]|jgi:hypothetical protein